MKIIQSILFDKKLYPLEDAKFYLMAKGYKSDVDITKDYYRFRQFPPPSEKKLAESGKYYKTVKSKDLRGVLYILLLKK